MDIYFYIYRLDLNLNGLTPEKYNAIFNKAAFINLRLHNLPAITEVSLAKLQPQ
jgi:hypothetical protein